SRSRRFKGGSKSGFLVRVSPGSTSYRLDSVEVSGSALNRRVHPWRSPTAIIRAGMLPGGASAMMGGSLSCERRSRTAARGMQPEIATQPSFTDLVERLRQDDRAAVGLLVERYGDALRRSIERALLVRRFARSG